MIRKGKFLQKSQKVTFKTLTKRRGKNKLRKVHVTLLNTEGPYLQSLSQKAVRNIVIKGSLALISMNILDIFLV